MLDSRDSCYQNPISSSEDALLAGIFPSRTVHVVHVYIGDSRKCLKTFSVRSNFRTTKVSNLTNFWKRIVVPPVVFAGLSLCFHER